MRSIEGFAGCKKEMKVTWRKKGSIKGIGWKERRYGSLDRVAVAVAVGAGAVAAE